MTWDTLKKKTDKMQIDKIKLLYVPESCLIHI